MFTTTIVQVKVWRDDKVYAVFKQVGGDIQVFSLRFKKKTKEQAQSWLSTNLPEENFKLISKNDKVEAQHFIIDTTNQTDAGVLYGTEHVRQQKNGISVRVNVDPSAEYQAILDARAAAAAEQGIEDDKKAKKDKLINDKMKELAIAELEKEGKL